MDTLTFLSRLLETITWPLVTVLLIFILRKEIRSLLPFIKKLKAGPVEAEFERDTKLLRNELEVEQPQLKSAPLSPKQQSLLQLAQTNPRSAILEAWQGIEFVVNKLSLQRALNMPLKITGSQNAIIRSFLDGGILTPDVISLYYELRNLRNQAVHEPDFNPSQEAVLNYIQLSDRLISSLERLQNRQAG